MVLGSGIRDPGSGKNLFRIPDPGVKKTPDHGSRIRIRNTGIRDGNNLDLGWEKGRIWNTAIKLPLRPDLDLHK